MENLGRQLKSDQISIQDQKEEMQETLKQLLEDEKSDKSIIIADNSQFE